MKHKKILAVSLAALLLFSTAVQFTSFGENLPSGSQEAAGAQTDADYSAADYPQADVVTEPSGGEDSNSPSGESTSEGADEDQRGDSTGTDNADGAGTGDSPGNTVEPQAPGTSEEQNTPDETEKEEKLDQPTGLKADSIMKNNAPVTFAWKWMDKNQQTEGVNRPENLLGTVTWTDEDSEPEIENAYMEIAVFVRNGEQYGYISDNRLVFGPEKKNMNLWQFWYYVGGYSWKFIHDHVADLINPSSTTNADGDVEITFATDSLITECVTTGGKKYTVSYGLEPGEQVPGYSVAHPEDGADADQTLVAEPKQTQDQETGENPGDEQKPADEELDDTVQDAVDEAVENLEEIEDAVENAAENDDKLTEEQIAELIEKIKSEINGLPNDVSGIATMTDEEFAVLKAKLQSIETDLEKLDAQTISDKLSTELTEKFQPILKAYDIARLAQIEERIGKIASLDETVLEVRQEELRKELTDLINEVAGIWADFKDDNEMQNKINGIRQNLIELLKKLPNWIDEPTALQNVKLNQEPVVLTWEWNDHNIQQTGAMRPNTPLLGTGTGWTADGTPYGQDAYIKLVVNVKRGNAAPETMSLWQFLTEECGYQPDYVKRNFPAFASATSRNLVSNNHGSDLKTTWEIGRLITAYTNKNGVECTVTYGLEQIKAIEGYQVERVDENYLRATPVEDFNATVVWYDNHNHYSDKEGITPRPDGGPEFREYKGKLTLLRYTDGEPNPVKIENPNINIENNPNAAPDSAADAWAITIGNLPKYGPGGEKYTYYLQQADSKNLQTEVSTGAYYEPKITNDDLVEDEHPELVKDDGTLINTLAREGKVKIRKVWKDGNTPEEERPETTLHYYRISETDLILHNEVDGQVSHTFFGFNGSPVPGNDSRTGIEAFDDAEEIPLPVNNETLPMFDEHGRRYVYYAVERMENQGDYVTKVDNSHAGPILLPDEELGIIREQATAPGHNYILNGATVTNKLEKKITIPVTVEFKAQSIQNDMENAEVKLQLQWKHKDGDWKDYNKAEADHPYNGQLTLNDFRSETMTLSGSSEPVDKYDEEGYEIEYRWVQTSIEVNGGTSGALDRETEKVTVRKDDNKDGNNEVGPGVDEDKTTLHFDVEYGVYGENDDNTKITNTLVGNTQVVVSKKWTYTDADGNKYVYSGEESEGNDKKWDGKPIPGVEKLPNGADWPAEIELKYRLMRNGQPYKQDGTDVFLTIKKGTTEAQLGGLPRYDENGNEYTYTLDENVPEEWFNISSGYTKSVQNDMVVDGDSVTQIFSAHENIVGPGEQLIFEVSKQWEDDTDIDTRHPVTVGVFSLDGGNQVTTAELNMQNNWYQKIVINAEKYKTVNDYVVKEISVGTGEKAVNVQYAIEDLSALKQKAVAFNEAFKQNLKNAINAREAAEKDLFEENRYNPAALNSYIVGTLGKGNTDPTGNLEFYYNVYLRTQNVDNNRAKYAIYNQR